MIQKIIKVGNSAAVTISRRLLDQWDISFGDYVETTNIKGQKKIVIEPIDDKNKIERNVDPEVYRVAKKLMRQYLPAFKKLANIN